MADVQRLVTPYAMVMRAKKLIKEIDDYFDDAESFGLDLTKSDPNGELLAIRKGLVAMIKNEVKIGRFKGDK